MKTGVLPSSGVPAVRQPEFGNILGELAERAANVVVGGGASGGNCKASS